MPSTLVAVYWNARAQTLEDCSSLARLHFEALNGYSDALCHWYGLACRKPKNPTEVDVASKASLSEILSNGVNRQDTDKSIIEDLGWSLTLWNGDSAGASASTNIHCNSTSAHVGNVALVKIKRDGGPGLSNDDAVKLLKDLIEIWRPDEGRVEQSVWDSERQERQIAEVASYKRTKWPSLISVGSERFAGGLLSRTK